MRRIETSAIACAIVAGAALLDPLALVAQRAAGGKATRPMRTPWGQPDLQGVWDFSNNTPLERPRELGTKAEYTEAEAAEQFKLAMERREKQESGEIYQDYSRAFTDDTRVSRQTSLLVDPPNGRFPAFTPAAQQWYAQEAKARKGVDGDAPTPGGWVEELGPRGYFVRCIVGFNAGPPLVPQSYNQNVQIFQGADHVALLHEMVHNARIAWLDGRQPVSNLIPQQNGHSLGRWEGDTLVVETTNFGRMVYDPRQGGGMRPNLNGTFSLTERFTRTGPHAMTYEWTINDSSWYTAPLTARLPLVKNAKPLYEYGCHEGNYGLMGILEGARHREAVAAKLKK